MWKGILFVVLLVHGLLHLLGFLKAFGLAELAALSQPITRPLGLLWLAASVFVVATSASLFVAPRFVWPLGALGLVLSQIAILSSFQDAKFGTVANVVLLAVVLVAFGSFGPFSFRAQFEREAKEGRARVAAEKPPVVSPSELEHLPASVKRYLEQAGFAGGPHTLSYELSFKMRIRGGPDKPWMNGVVEQVSFANPPTRLFLLSATMYGLPVQALHRYRDGHATFQVRLLGLFNLVDAKGPELDRTETVTVLNDMFLLAPATLLSPNLRWEALGPRLVRATLEVGVNRVSADVSFDEQGLPKNFISDDRGRASPDGTLFLRQRFSTPILEVRDYPPHRLVARGEARWHAPPPEGEFAYAEYELDNVAYNSAR